MLLNKTVVLENGVFFGTQVWCGDGSYTTLVDENGSQVLSKERTNAEYPRPLEGWMSAKGYRSFMLWDSPGLRDTGESEYVQVKVEV